MEVVPHRQRRIQYVKVRTINDNKMWERRSRSRSSPCCSYYDPSPRRDQFKHYGETKSKSPPHTSWWNDNDVKRKRRVAKYKLYEAEGKVKKSLKNGFRSFRITCAKIATNL